MKRRRALLLPLPSPRLPRGGGEWLAAAVVMAFGGLLLLEFLAVLGGLLARNWPVTVACAGACALVAAGAGVLRLRARAAAYRARSNRLGALRLRAAQLDAMSDRDFELAARDLLIRDGLAARHVGQRGDQAADVIAEDPRIGRLVVQCKHTTVGGKVGSQVMYQVKGTAGPVHGADHAVVVTNGGFTRDARVWGDRHEVHWVDRARLVQWAEGGVSMPEILGLPVARPRRNLPLRRAPHATAVDTDV